MVGRLYQYQSLVEPLLPPAAPAPSVASWMPAICQPVRLPVVQNSGSWVGVLEPTLFVVPKVASWHPAICQPVLPIPPPNRGIFVAPILVSATAFTVPSAASWLQPISQPVLPPPSPNRGSFELVVPLNLVPTQGNHPDAWNVQAPLPVQLPPLPNSGSWAGVLNPSLFTVPLVNSWLPAGVTQPLAQPARVQQPDSFTFVPQPQTTAIPLMTSWWRPAEQPIVRQPHVEGSFVIGLPPELLRRNLACPYIPLRPDEADSALPRHVSETDLILRRPDEADDGPRRRPDEGCC